MYCFAEASSAAALASAVAFRFKTYCGSSLISSSLLRGLGQHGDGRCEPARVPSGGSRDAEPLPRLDLGPLQAVVLLLRRPLLENTLGLTRERSALVGTRPWRRNPDCSVDELLQLVEVAF